MAYTKKQKGNIRFDYESGRYTVSGVAAKWGMSRTTLLKFADDHDWMLGERSDELNKKVEELAADTLIMRDAQRLVGYVEEHLETIGQIDETYRVLLGFHIAELKESEGLLSKADGDKWQSNYKAFQIAIDSIDKSFRSKRLAMGLKETEAPKMQMNINLTKIENVEKMSDAELDYIIAHEGDAVESETIN